MPIQVTRLPGEPIITAVFEEPADFHAEVPAMFQRVIELRDTIEDSDRYFFIMDVSAARLSFSDIVFAMGESRIARDQRRDDLPVTTLMVGSGPLLEMAAKAMNQRQYGGYGMRLCTSMDEALSVIHEVV